MLRTRLCLLPCESDSGSMLVCFLFTINFLRTFAFKADVLLVENGIHTRRQFEIVNEDVPPFSVPRNSNTSSTFETLRGNSTYDSQRKGENQRTRGKRGFGKSRSNSESTYTGVKVTGIFGKRLARDGAIRWKPCITKQDGRKSSNSVLTVEKGESISLPCHDCHSLETLKFEPMQWIKMDSLPDKNGMYRVREVIPEMHDDKRRNRLVINLDHVLHIKQVRRSDAGSYFCKAIGDTRRVLNTRLSWEQMNEWLTSNVSLNHFYHIDVLDLNHETFVDVTDHVTSKLYAPEVIKDLNILVLTRWTPWSECNVCDELGIQKRIGVCVVKKLDFQDQVPNMYLDHILGFADDGLLCKSEYLKQFSNEKWLTRPNEASVRECYTPCPVDRQKRDRPTLELVSNKKPKKVTEKTLKAGEYLILVCPGSTVREVSTWVNGTKSIPLMQIKNSTDKRITFDLFGNLHFAKVILSDTAEYSCWLKKKLKKRFKITVVPNHLHEVYTYLMVLLLVFAVDLVVFILLAVIKAVHRKSQVMRRKHKDVKETDGDETLHGAKEKGKYDKVNKKDEAGTQKDNSAKGKGDGPKTKERVKKQLNTPREKVKRKEAKRK